MRVRTNYSLLKARKTSNVLNGLTHGTKITCIVHYIYDSEYDRTDSIMVNLNLEELNEVARKLDGQDKVTEVEKALGRNWFDVIITDKNYGIIGEINNISSIHKLFKEKQ